MQRFFHKDVLFSTLFVFLVMYLLKLFIFNIHFLDPIANALKDFKFTDIYYSRLQDKKQGVDTNLVIVNIAYNNRKEIADQIKLIESFGPAVIGLDITFEESKGKESDSLLQAVLNKTDNVVLASYFEYNDPHDDHISGYVRSAEKFRKNTVDGFINFPSLEEQSTIRRFTPEVEYHGENYYAFPVQIVKKYDEQAFEKLVERDNKSEVIRYKGGEDRYIVFSPEEISPGNNSLNVVQNKIVLLGFLGVENQGRILEDIHFTPLNHKYSGRTYPDMYGVTIHANIISTILEGRYVNKMPLWLGLLISFVILYVNMYFFIRYYVHMHVWYHLFAKMAQLVISVIIVGIELWLYASFRYKINTAIIIVPIILSIDVLYVYDGLVKFLKKKFNYKTWLSEH